MTVAAFFDMDRTLVRRSSNLLWIRYVLRRREIGLGELARVAGIMARYAVGKLDVPALTHELARDLAGQREADRIAFTARWFSEQLIRYVAPRGKAVLAEHRRRGHQVALITGSPVYTANALAEHLAIPPDDVLATRFEVENGRFTGRVVEPVCFGQGKLEKARTYARDRGIALAQSYFYTDSIVDLPLLKRVGHPVAVNPDRGLAQMAGERGWRVERFF